MRFADTLRTGKLASKATFEEMTKNRNPTPVGPRYGYGIGIDSVYGIKVVGHNGGTLGVSTDLQWFLSAPYTIVVLENIDPPLDRAYASERALALVTEKINVEHGISGK